MKTINLTFLLVVTLSCHISSAANKCAEVFAKFDLTPAIQESINRSISDLAKLRLSIDKAQARGKNSFEQAVLQNNYKTKENELSKYLETHGLMSLAQLKTKIMSEIVVLELKNKQSSKEDEETARQIKKDQIALIEKLNFQSQAAFHRIQPGSFTMGTAPDEVSVILTKPFEMMATPITQIMWEKIVKAIDKTTPGQVNLPLNPSTIQSEGHPLESATLNQVLIWIKNLNSLSAYGLDLTEIIPSHKMGDVYRLPTEAEWEFVARGANKPVDLQRQLNEMSLDDYAWTSQNSIETSHTVGTRKPLIIEGQDFYDLFGNVSELTLDFYHGPKPPGGTDPVSLEPSDKKVVRGGDYTSHRSAAKATFRGALPLNDANTTIGFRLVRVVKP